MTGKKTKKVFNKKDYLSLFPQDLFYDYSKYNFYKNLLESYKR
jgi:hypothetical protein